MQKVNSDFKQKKPINELLAKEPTEISEENVNVQILRLGIIAEMDAISLYEQLAAKATDENVKKLFLDIVKEEKTHVGEFETMLLSLDTQQKDEIINGKQEVEDLTNNNNEEEK